MSLDIPLLDTDFVQSLKSHGVKGLLGTLIKFNLWNFFLCSILSSLFLHFHCFQCIIIFFSFSLSLPPFLSLLLFIPPFLYASLMNSLPFWFFFFLCSFSSFSSLKLSLFVCYTTLLHVQLILLTWQTCFYKILALETRWIFSSAN